MFVLTDVNQLQGGFFAIRVNVPRENVVLQKIVDANVAISKVFDPNYKFQGRNPIVDGINVKQVRYFGKSKYGAPEFDVVDLDNEMCSIEVEDCYLNELINNDYVVFKKCDS